MALTALVLNDGPVFKAGSIVEVEEWGSSGSGIIYRCSLNGRETLLVENQLTAIGETEEQNG